MAGSRRARKPKPNPWNDIVSDVEVIPMSQINDAYERMLKGDASLKTTVDLLSRVVDTLGEGTPLYRAGLNDDERADLKEFFFLTNKPVMAVLNIGEDQIGDEDAIAAPVREELNGAEVVPPVSTHPSGSGLLS